MYTYKMIQVPPNVSVASKGRKGNEAADYLESVVNKMADDGWEFQRVDAIGIHVQPGCFGGIFGKGAEQEHYYVITFRKPLSDAS
ncbi:DUF4177 domain-containing protein [Vreelandella titanicae]|uniref:DUF4177 domain-containing protein n=1 Tax=Vreelandella titanicae TaxID=664683 RepID=A0AAP9NRS9_9GAMM|nr:DUF4177 domain-containing protein [Halomonas titanicae]QKS26558.1 hypothetical protein FX987_04367 [Halomonas titanicae]